MAPRLHISSYMRSREHMESHRLRRELEARRHLQWSGLWDITDEAVNQIINNEKGAAQATDEIAQQAQAFLDDLFAQ